MNTQKELFSPQFEAIFPTIDETIKNIHPDIRVRKVYAFLRTKGLSEEEAREYINELKSN